MLHTKAQDCGPSDSVGRTLKGFIPYMDVVASLVLEQDHLSHDMRFQIMLYVRPSKPQIRLRIHAV